jgi:O-antigen/teichoic acid export membrane protein
MLAAKPWRAAVADLRRSEAMRAAVMGIANTVSVAVQLVFAVVFARILGDDYGSLGRLVSFFLILAVPGLAFQAAVARDVAIGELGVGAHLAAAYRAWSLRLGAAIAVVAVLSVAFRHQLADLLSVSETWAAAAAVASAGLWGLVCLQRGLLQGLQWYGALGWSIVFEAMGRLVISIVLVAAGGSVTGAFLGTPLSILATLVALHIVFTGRLGRGHEHVAERLRALLIRSWAPIVSLGLLAILQYADVILVGREFPEAQSSAYAAASVAAKVTFFMSLGLALHVLPESARRAAQGERPIGVLWQALGLLAAVAVPAMLLYALVPDLLLQIAFGGRFGEASDALVVLGAAYTLLAVTYLAVQFMLALHRSAFVTVLVLAVVTEVAVLIAADGTSLRHFAALVLAVQTVVGAIVLALAVVARPRTPLAEPADSLARHEGDHPGGGSRLSPERRDGDAPEANGGDRGQADPVAHHDPVRRARPDRLRGLPRL